MRMTKILLSSLIAVFAVSLPGNLSWGTVSAQQYGSAIGGTKGEEKLIAPISALLSIAGTGKVAILGAPGTPSWNTDVQNKILSTGIFAQVDVFNVAGGNPVPTLAQLQQYCAVLVFSDTSFNDNVALGNVLADYMDAGGGVVLATFSYWVSSAGLGISGRIVTAGYLPFTQAGQSQGTPLTLITDQPGHPIFSGVSSFNGGSSSYHNNSITTTAGTTLLGHWSNGQPLVAIKKPTTGTIVGLNLYPPSSDARSDFWVSSTDGARLMANALNFACGAFFDLCLQDESNGNILQVNLTTGAYQFTNCHGFTLGGTGAITIKGCYVTLQVNGPDRRVLARIDTCMKSGTASVQVFSPGRTFTVLDRNTTNNTCACPAVT